MIWTFFDQNLAKIGTQSNLNKNKNYVGSCNSQLVRLRYRAAPSAIPRLQSQHCLAAILLRHNNSYFTLIERKIIVNYAYYYLGPVMRGAAAASTRRVTSRSANTPGLKLHQTFVFQ